MLSSSLDNSLISEEHFLTALTQSDSGPWTGRHPGPWTSHVEHLKLKAGMFLCWLIVTVRWGLWRQQKRPFTPLDGGERLAPFRWRRYIQAILHKPAGTGLNAAAAAAEAHLSAGLMTTNRMYISSMFRPLKSADKKKEKTEKLRRLQPTEGMI